MLKWTVHARRRCAQRAISSEHAELAMAWGREIGQNHGRVAFHLGWREARRAREVGVHVPARAVGVIIVLAEDSAVLTAVRSPDRHRLRSFPRARRGMRRRGGRA